MQSSLRDELTGEVDEVFSEPIRLLPMAGGSSDPTRAPVEIAAVLRTGERHEERPTFIGASGRRPGVLAGGGSLRIDRAAWPDAAPRKGDKIVALERMGLPVFEVLGVEDRAHLRLICDLGEAN